jgi:hypothetical protein
VANDLTFGGILFRYVIGFILYRSRRLLSRWRRLFGELCRWCFSFLFTSTYRLRDLSVTSAHLWTGSAQGRSLKECTSKCVNMGVRLWRSPTNKAGGHFGKEVVQKNHWIPSLHQVVSTSKLARPESKCVRVPWDIVTGRCLNFKGWGCECNMDFPYPKLTFIACSQKGKGWGWEALSIITVSRNSSNGMSFRLFKGA